MQSTQSAVLNALHRVRGFMDKYDDRLAMLNRARCRCILDEAIASLAEHSATQDASRRASVGRTAQLHALRNALRLNHMRPIVVIAALKLRRGPGPNVFELPPSTVPTPCLIEAARAIAASAAHSAGVFVDAGLAVTFTEDLEAAAMALDDAMVTRRVISTTQADATAALEPASARGRAAIKVLDALIEPRLGGDPVGLAEWKAAKRIEGRRHSMTGIQSEARLVGTVTDDA